MNLIDLEVKDHVTLGKRLYNLVNSLEIQLLSVF